VRTFNRLSGKLRRIFDVAFTVLARCLEVTHIISNSVGYAPQNARVFGRFFHSAGTIGAAGAILTASDSGTDVQRSAIPVNPGDKKIKAI
jgi:hypothetical protein